ncbi:MAG: hypothetical protein RLO52_03085 [Sandaracinaceae bacterium]
MAIRELSRAQRRLRKLRWFRAIPSGWAEHARAYRALSRALRVPAQTISGPSLVVILPVFTRPENLCLSVALALRTPGVTEVRICVNDPAIDAESLLDELDDRVVFDRADERRGPVERYLAAARSGGEAFVSLDDDIFLHPRQLRALADRARAEPRCPHGLYGQRYDASRGRFTQNLCRREGSVHVLNRLYAFSADQLDRYLALLGAAVADSHAARVAIDDDVVLSFSGDGLPQVHDLGPWIDCPTETDPRVSRFGRIDAAERRRQLYRSLDARVGTRPAIAPMAPQPRWPWAPRTALGAGLYYASGAPVLRAAARATLRGLTSRGLVSRSALE